MLPLKNAGNIDVQLKLKVILTFTFLIRSGVWVSLCDILGSDCGTYSGESLIFGSCFSCFLHFHLFNLSLTPLVRSLTNFVSCCSFFNFSLLGRLIFSSLSPFALHPTLCFFLCCLVASQHSTHHFYALCPYFFPSLFMYNVSHCFSFIPVYSTVMLRTVSL